MATALIFITLINFINIYFVLILIRILLSWFQTAEWAYNMIAFLSPITDPYLNIFRAIIPPLGGLDISPLLAILALELISKILEKVPDIF
jgi:YggT family protein